MEYQLTVEGMHCDSCAKMIERIVSKNDGAQVKALDTTANTVTLNCNPEQLSIIQSQLKERGYQLLLPGQVAEEGFEGGKLARGISFLSNVIQGKPGFGGEHRLLGYSIISFFLIIAMEIGLYFLIFKNIPNFISSYWSVLLLTAISIPVILNGVFHSEAFRKKATCMTGMMIGMTFGMAAGFLFGAFAGATNGMFIGSLVGVAIGMGLGYYTGKCCGVMGVMEGLMGGLMAGTMGAMLSVMLIYDNLIPFLFILTGIEMAIMLAFSYMLYKENGPLGKEAVEVELVDFATYAVALAAVLTLIYVFAPKAGVVLGL
ncbi:MAG: cation transporter [Candidatus Micrarchaeota archaeon]